MKPTTHQLFAIMCKAVILEASSTLPYFRNKPGAVQVIKHLHQIEDLSHDQKYTQIPKISWNDLKDRERGWVVVIGPRGCGAIKALGGSYTAFCSNGGPIQDFKNERGGNILDFLQANLGGRWQNYDFYIGTDDRSVMSKRKSRTKVAAPTKTINKEALLKKFRPLWLKSVNIAIADCKGMAVTMIKNDSLAKASKKIKHTESLIAALDVIESGDETSTPSIIYTAISSAIAMSAAHYYPEDTGDIHKSSSYTSNQGEYSTSDHRGPLKLLADISNGDTKKLGTVLGFFKRSLISG